MRITKKQREQIEANKRNGLLCACNQAVIPYGEEGEHGNVVILGTVHGYDDCQPLRDWVRGIIREELQRELH